MRPLWLIGLFSTCPSGAFLLGNGRVLQNQQSKSMRMFHAPGREKDVGYAFSLKSMETDDDDTNDNETDSTFNSTSSTGSNTTVSILDKVKEQSISEGIGGQGGHVFDVNLLKRNLLQDTMVAYKAEFFKLLNSPRSSEQEISEKLSALVEGSPVRTTSDSNLLEGTWALAYTSKHSSVMNLREATATQLIPTKEISDAAKTPAMKRIKGKGSLFKSIDRSFYLEELDDNEDPYVVEKTTMFGGLFIKQTRLRVKSLTRQSLLLRPVVSTVSFCGFSWEKFPKEKSDYELKIVYADVNLCITAVGESGHQKYNVYTKNEAWLDSRKRFERKVSFTAALFVSFFTRFIPGWGQTKMAVESDMYADSEHLRVLKLGSAVNEDDESWDSVSDPFIHLSADERQRILKAMSIGQIERAGIQGKSKYQRDKLWRPGFFKRRKTFFKQPVDKSK